MGWTDIDAIINVLGSWALGYDEHDLDRLAACFTNDAEMMLEIPGQPTMGPYVGHAKVMKHFTDHHETQTDQRRHIVVNPIVEMISATLAKTTSLLVLAINDDEGIRMQATRGLSRPLRCRRRHLAYCRTTPAPRRALLTNVSLGSQRRPVEVGAGSPSDHN